MAYFCIRATTLDKIIHDRAKVVEAKEDGHLAFWSGYQSALEWIVTQIHPLLENHIEK